MKQSDASVEKTVLPLCITICHVTRTANTWHNISLHALEHLEYWWTKVNTEWKMQEIAHSKHKACTNQVQYTNGYCIVSLLLFVVNSVSTDTSQPFMTGVDGTVKLHSWSLLF